MGRTKSINYLLVTVIVGLFTLPTPAKVNADKENKIALGGLLILGGCVLVEKLVQSSSGNCKNNIKKLFSNIFQSNTKSAPGSAPQSITHTVTFTGTCKINANQILNVQGEGCEYLTGEIGVEKKESYILYNLAKESLFEAVKAGITITQDGITTTPEWALTKNCPSGSERSVGITGEQKEWGAGPTPFENASGRLTVQCLTKSGLPVGRVYEIEFERSSTHGFYIHGWVEGIPLGDKNYEYKHYSILAGKLPGEARIEKVISIRDGRMTIDHYSGYSCFIAIGPCDPKERYVQYRDQEVWCDPFTVSQIKPGDSKARRNSLVGSCDSAPTLKRKVRAFHRQQRPNNPKSLAEEDQKPQLLNFSEVFNEHGRAKKNSHIHFKLKQIDETATQ